MPATNGSGAVARAQREGPDVAWGWTEKQGGVIGTDERLPWGAAVALGAQHVLAMFGATVVAPLIMGFDPNLAILFSGIGTIIFFLVVGGRIPSYLGSSFAFIGPVAAVTGGGGSLAQALGGIFVAGALCALIGIAVHLTGAGWIDALMPPLVTGAVVMIIGLNLAGAARGLAGNDPLLAAVTILAIFAVGLRTRGLVSRLPILLGAVVGYLVALVLGGTSAAGRDLGGLHVSGVDLAKVADAPWFGLPRFVRPEFTPSAITLIAPVAVILIAENTGHVKAVAAMTGTNLMPWLGRGFLGDGIATMVASMGGGTGVTTYAENIGVMAVTRVFSTLNFLIAAVVAIGLGLSPKFGALVQTIPGGVLGGVTTVLFGLIAVTGARIWVDNKVDFTLPENLFVAAVTLIVGAADYTVSVGQFALNGIALGTFAAILLHAMFKTEVGKSGSREVGKKST